MNTLSPNFVLADYKPVSNPAYANNPFIRHFGDLPDDLTLSEALQWLPEFDISQRLLPGNQRIDMLSGIHKICVPLPRLVKLARAMLKLMRAGYEPRTPYSHADNQQVKSLFEAQKQGFGNTHQTRMSGPDLARQMSMALIGSSGAGKSFSLRHISGLVDEVIYHPKFGKWQIPFLFVEMSYDGASVQTLAYEIYRELDSLLPDACYTDLYMNRSGWNAQQRLAKAFSICHEHGVGMTIVDESQNKPGSVDESASSSGRSPGPKSKKGRESPLTKLLITASNCAHIPLMFSGTLEMQNTLGVRFSFMRRMAGNGSAKWLPLQRSGNLNKPGEFEMLLVTLLAFQYVRMPITLDDQWAALFWDLTQGIPDIMVKLWAAVQEAAIASLVETITPELVQAVYFAEFQTVLMALRAMREDNKTVLSTLTDLYPAEDDSEALFEETNKPARKKKVYPSPRAATVSVATDSKADIRSAPGGSDQEPEISRWSQSNLV